MRNRFVILRVCLTLVLAGIFSMPAFAQYSNAVMPGPGWQVIKAEWGSGNRWADVTNQVRVLLSGNGGESEQPELGRSGRWCG